MLPPHSEVGGPRGRQGEGVGGRAGDVAVGLVAVWGLLGGELAGVGQAGGGVERELLGAGWVPGGGALNDF